MADSSNTTIILRREALAEPDMSGRDCKWCGADISSRHGRAKFCDEKCALRNRYGGPIPGDNVKCKWCSQEFVKQNNERHCSTKCREEYQAFQNSLRYEQPKIFHGPHPSRTCAGCGVKFEMRDTRQVFCERNGPCYKKSWRRTENAKTYFSSEDVKNRQREARRRHYTSEHGKAAQKARDAKPSNRERRREYGKELRKCEIGAMRCRISCLHSSAIRRIGEIKRSPTMEQLGYTAQELADHLERQFVKGMGWHNRDKWHIDHIVPISTAKTIEDVIALNQLSNLRPLWAQDNLSKSNKLEYMI